MIHSLVTALGWRRIAIGVLGIAVLDVFIALLGWSIDDLLSWSGLA